MDLTKEYNEAQDKYKTIRDQAKNKHFRRGEANKVIEGLCNAILNVMDKLK